MLNRRKLLIGAGAAVGAVAYMLAIGAWRSQSAAPQSPRPDAITQMNWQLTDHNGATVTPADWIGRPTLVFFGFTWCPDVCPTTLMDISGWLEDLGPEADALRVVLITVDPARDTPEVLANYVGLFDPRITGLTGAPDQIAAAAQHFRVRYTRVAREDGDYTMDHTAGVFLFHADGRFGRIIDFHEDRAFAVPKIRQVLT
ncbi:SCO family protein [Ketogulonicigenium vulgare]|uniref:SCO family protein n=1 Tax=Ketogulonicigenium vulgare TaxID=92945 RepID=UPI0023597A73|nr:SCO family protein [Ketogulonicigenium vulgare]